MCMCVCVLALRIVSRDKILRFKKYFNYYYTTFLTFLHQPLLICLFLCFGLLLLLCIYLLAYDEDNFQSKALEFPCFLVFRRTSEYISLDLFYSFSDVCDSGQFRPR